MSSFRDAVQVFVHSVVFKLLTINTKLYFSTDFEVHRNWMAITYSVPFSEWYKEARNVWTLDYPPFFAYFEYLLAHIAALVDPGMVDVNNTNYASWNTIAFQRLSVSVISDLVLAAGVWMALPQTQRIRGLILTLFSSTLFVVDHIHFQYNGMLLGMLLISIAFVERGRYMLGALTYMILVWSKHIFLFCAPVYFVYFLWAYVFRASGLGAQIYRFLSLFGVVVAVSAVALIPIVRTDQFGAMIVRLFPFGRGLVHDYWAPNFWALYSGLDRFLGSLERLETGSSTPIGPHILMALPNVSVSASVLLTVCGYFALFALLLSPSRKPPPFGVWVGLGNAVAICFGWHVHEKAVLMIQVPLLMAGLAGKISKIHVWRLSLVANVAVMPLLHRREEVVLNWLIMAAGALLQAVIFDLKLEKFWSLLAVSAQFYGDFLHSFLLGKRLWFLPLALNSVMSAVLLGQCLWQILREFAPMAKSKSKRV